jgi:hypothetical protein
VFQRILLGRPSFRSNRPVGARQGGIAGLSRALLPRPYTHPTTITGSRSSCLVFRRILSVRPSYRTNRPVGARQERDRRFVYSSFASPLHPPHNHNRFAFLLPCISTRPVGQTVISYKPSCRGEARERSPVCLELFCLAPYTIHPHPITITGSRSSCLVFRRVLSGRPSYRYKPSCRGEAREGSPVLIELFCLAPTSTHHHNRFACVSTHPVGQTVIPVKPSCRGEARRDRRSVSSSFASPLHPPHNHNRFAFLLPCVSTHPVGQTVISYKPSCRGEARERSPVCLELFCLAPTSTTITDSSSFYRVSSCVLSGRPSSRSNRPVGARQGRGRRS